MSTSSFTANGVYILSAGLLFLVLSSKNVLIYNEELLILLSFIGFVGTSSYTMGDSIAETFQSRRDLIQEELQAFFTTKETMLHEVKHQTIMQTALATSMIALGSLVQKELQTLHTQRDMTVKNTVQTHTIIQLQHMMAGEQASYARVHTMSSAAYKFMMIDAYHMDKQNMHDQFMQNALHLLKNMHKKKMHLKVLARISNAAFLMTTPNRVHEGRTKGPAQVISYLPDDDYSGKWPDPDWPDPDWPDPVWPDPDWPDPVWPDPEAVEIELEEDWDDCEWDWDEDESDSTIPSGGEK